VNFVFGATITLFAGIWVPCVLATAFGLVPALVLWRVAKNQVPQVAMASIPVSQRSQLQPVQSSVNTTADLPIAPLSGK
jgi:hypothetical protein